MPDIRPFFFGEHQVRAIVDEQDRYWFVAKDICDVLNLSNPSEAIKGLDDDERSTLSLTEGGSPANIISESGMYWLVMRCRKKSSHRFRKWVTSEVLPSLRKNGRYEMPAQEAALPPADGPEYMPPVTVDVFTLPIPQDVIEAQSGIRPQMRAHLLAEARQLVNNDASRLLDCYKWQCLLLSQGTPASARLRRAKSRETDMAEAYRVALRFLESHTEEDPASNIKAMDLYLAFSAWCEEHLENICSMKRFGMVAHDMYPSAKNKRGNVFYKGVKLKEAA